MNCAIERRGQARTALTGEVLWQSNEANGRCRLVDLSPRAACLLLEGRDSLRIGETVSLVMPLAGSMEWLIARDARIVRRRERADGRIRVVVKRDIRTAFGHPDR
jgi:hypothetical protein